MLERIIELEPHITMSFIFGSRSWIDRQAGFQTKYILATAANSANALAVPNSSSDSDEEEPERVNVHIMNGSGHHVYADNPEEFNQLVVDICTEVDCVMLQAAMEEQGNDFEWDNDDSHLQQQVAAGAMGPGNLGNISTGSGWVLENGGSVLHGQSGPTNSVPGSPSIKMDLQQNVHAIPEEDSY